MNSFGEFINSEYFNKNINLVKLFDEIRKYHPMFEDERLTKENIYKEVLGKKKYSDEKMRNLISDLMKLCKRFLIQKELEKRNVETNLFLLANLREREQNGLFDYEFDKTFSNMEKNYKKERDYYYLSYMMKFEKYYTRPEETQDKSEKNFLLENITLDFERFFLLEMLDFNYSLLTQNIKRNKSLRYLFLDVVKQKVEQSDYSDAPLIPIKYKIIMAIENQDKEKYFEEAEKLFLENYDKLSGFEQATMQLGLSNYCWLKIAAGEDRYFEKVFKLYKVALESNIFFHNNKYLLATVFNNIVKCAIYQNELLWLSKFLTNYRNKIAPANRKEVISVSLAKYYFERNNFDLALKYISKLNPDYALLKLELKALNIKIYYELDYFDSLYSLVDSTKHFLKSTVTIAAHQINQNKYFLKYILKIVKLKESVSGKNRTTELHFLKKEIEGIKDFGAINKRWMLKKIDELI